MKYFITVIINCLFLTSCINLKNDKAQYILANNAIDSISYLTNTMLKFHDAIAEGQNMDPYIRMTIDRYAFVKIYLIELNQMQDGPDKEKLKERYTNEIKIDPQWLFPYIARDSVGMELTREK